MAYSKPGYQRSGKYTGKSSGKYVHPRVKLSLLGRAYNKVRWTCYFLPILGFIIMGYGLFLAMRHPMNEIVIAQTVIVGGAIITYLSIYYNKRT